MNIFILNAGRCGSLSFIKACQHITNYSALHESRSKLIGAQRLAYADNHIEADNRLSWLLGRLDREYADNAFYVHLQRDTNKTANSFAKRSDFGIMLAYKEGILLGGNNEHTAHDTALDYLDTVEANIALFLKDKTNVMNFQLENARQDFKTFWHTIAAAGDLDKALREWDTAHNASV